MDFSTMVLSAYLDVDDTRQEEERVLGIAIEQALESGRRGLNPWTTEHHFRGPWHSNPIQFMSYLVPQLPEGTYLGFGVLSIPYYHPVRLVEQMNLLDQLTKGRTLFGMGSGFPGLEPFSVGLEEDHHRSGRAAREAIDILERLWEYETVDPPLEFDNGLHRGKVVKRVTPAAYRQRRPTIIRTARNDEATVTAAERGWPIFLGTYGGDGSIVEQLKTYRHALAAAGHTPDTVAQCLRWTTVDWTSVVVAKTDAAAEQAVEEARQEKMGIWERFWAKSDESLEREGALQEVAADPVTRELIRSGRSRTIAGSPETIAGEVQQLVDLGVNHLLVRFSGEWPGRTRWIAERSLELFTEEVVPLFRDVPPLTDPLAIDLEAIAN